LNAICGAQKDNKTLNKGVSTTKINIKDTQYSLLASEECI